MTAAESKGLGVIIVAAAIATLLSCSIQIESGVAAHHSEAVDTPVIAPSPAATPTPTLGRG